VFAGRSRVRRPRLDQTVRHDKHGRSQRGLATTRHGTLERRVAALERVVGRPVQAPVGEPSEQWASDEVRGLVRQGNKINAIKQLMAETGMGIKDARDIVDRL
jgi:large subunit ribosomal protein L7/L12